MPDSADVLAGPTRHSAVVAEIEKLGKTFAKHKALRDVDLRLAAYEISALVGANGSGKSTLIKVLSGYHTPDAGGSVRIGGKPLTFGSPSPGYPTTGRTLP